MIEQRNIKTQQIAETLNKSKRSIGYAIKSLKESPILSRVGSDKTAYWEILVQ